VSDSTHTGQDIRDKLRAAIGHFEHLLPGQAPIRDFVHHNTLHGYQHLHFTEALAESKRLTGARGYLTDEQFRGLFKSGRITREELRRILDEDEELEAGQLIAGASESALCRGDVYAAALLHPIKPVTACQLNWQIEELEVLRRFQPDLAHGDRERLLAAAREHGIEGEAAAVDDLWNACLEGLGLTHYLLHPEDMLDLSPEQAQRMLAELSGEAETGAAPQPLVERLIRKEADHLLNRLLERVGKDLTLEGLLRVVTGRDVLAELRPALLRQMANYLDQGMASWHSEAREEGFYAVWRRTAADDLSWVFEELPDWYSHLESLPDDPMETIVTELRRLGLRQSKWVGYIERLALELPGWSGMFLWRQLHPGYEGLKPGRIEMVDYLAVRMVLEHLFAQRLCAELWQLEASLDLIRWYFRHHNAEFLVRHSLYSARLPEYLTSLAQRLTEHTAREAPGEKAWWQLAHRVHTWRQSPVSDRQLGVSVYRGAWRLFRLAQHLGLCGAEIRSLERTQLQAMLDCVDRLTPDKRGFIWLQAYERHYREQLFAALAANHGSEPGRVERASAQLVFCMDDREEGFRRHLEEVDPGIETYGGAAHFNVPNNWLGLDESRVVPLTPVVIVPVNEIREQPRPGQEGLEAQRAARRSRRFRLGDLLHQEIRRNLLSSTLTIALAAPGALLHLAGKVFAPLGFGRLERRLLSRYEPPVATRLALTAADDDREATPAHPRIGFTEDEQLNRVETLLRNLGLVDNFAPLVVIVAHGSNSQNNPHLAAYDCGACSGRHSGPNARIFAAMSNRQSIRQRLSRERGIAIPDETWFLGAEHNTCSETIEWYDLDDLPGRLQTDLKQLRRSLNEAERRHAHERCRRLASAPRTPTLERALEHVRGRELDFSQARPELGHATNAAAIIGRRCVSRGAFFDRRVFLISYDYTTDPSGQVLERLLLANGPVGAGINLEYYFSTVDNERYGCGSKVTHNVTGMFGVMDGTTSDLRTGLPKQMIEIHEAMRLQVVVEAGIAILSEIYGRNPELQELIGNGWILLSAMDPESGVISTFEPKVGFVPWNGRDEGLARVDCSIDWYRGHSEPLPPALVTTRMGDAHV